MSKVGAIIGLIMFVAMTVFFGTYAYHKWIAAQEATDECFQTKNDYIAEYGPLPKKYEHMCESPLGLFGDGK